MKGKTGIYFCEKAQFVSGPQLQPQPFQLAIDGEGNPGYGYEQSSSDFDIVQQPSSMKLKGRGPGSVCTPCDQP